MKTLQPEERDLKILFLSSEVAPFSCTGSLGEISNALPKALRRQGHDIRVITPRYRQIGERKYGLRDVARLRSLPISIGDVEHECTILSGFIPKSKVQVYFIDNQAFFDRDGIYTNDETAEEWHDNQLRFTFLSHATLHLMLHLQWVPDIIHCNDWQTALIPYLICTDERYKTNFANTRTVLQIHNINQHGSFAANSLSECGVNPIDIAEGHPLEFKKDISFLKGGITTADQLVFVRPTFENSNDNTCDVDEDLKIYLSMRENSIHNVPNCIDPQWNPRYDNLLEHPFSDADFEIGKDLNKTDLQEEYGLIKSVDIPIIAVIAEQAVFQGLDLLEKAALKLLKLDAQWIFLGSGDEAYRNLVSAWCSDYPSKVASELEYSKLKAHQIIAGSDIYLSIYTDMPHDFNPMHSLLYGTIPVFRNPDFFDNITTNINIHPESGCCFTFDDYNHEALFDTMNQAITTFQQKDDWREIQIRGIQCDFSWDVAVNQLIELYRKILAEPKFFSDTTDQNPLI